MKFNKWTLGLAAVGVVSLASAARADEKMSTVSTALSTTTLSGYVDTGAQYVSATGAPYGQPQVGDSMGLNVVDIALDKPMDATPFSAGYHVELWAGPEAATVFPTQGNVAVRQAYLALGTTIGGQEIDWKIGVWDTIIGYEGLTSGANPNYSHSIGFGIEPTTHTGVLGSYKVNDSVSIQAGVADDSFNGGAYAANINGVAGTRGTLHHPTFLAAVSLTAPDSFGALKGATLTIGGIDTADAGSTSASGAGENLYVGATIPTSNAALKFGAAFDYESGQSTFGLGSTGHTWVAGLYGTYQASDKLTFNVRGEVDDFNGSIGGFSGHNSGEELTATASYALWANVLSRVEVRWDHAENIAIFTGNSTFGAEKNAVLLAAQLIYTF